MLSDLVTWPATECSVGAEWGMLGGVEIVKCHHLCPEGRSRCLGQTQLQKAGELHANGQRIFTLSVGLHMLVHD